MDYEKLYKEALNKAKEELQCCGTLECDAARQIFRFFPELAESEDEKIRKTLIDLVNGIKSWNYFLGISKEQMIDWLEKQDEKDSQVILPTFTFDDILALQCCMRAMSKNDELYKKLQSLHDRLHEVYGFEKQGEQKSSWSEKDEKIIETMCKEGDLKPSEMRWLKSLKDRVQSQPKQEWSEYDKIQLSEAIQMIEANGTWIRSEDAIKKVSNWLKSLKPNHWKPSEYDISLLEEIARNIRNNIKPFCSEVSSLEVLIDTLKNL